MVDLPAAEIQRRMREYGEPTWGYRLDADGEIEKNLFDGTLPAGWSDSPANVRQPSAADGKTLKRKEAPVDDPDNPRDRLVPPYDRYGFHQLRIELKARTGKGSRPGTTTEQLIAMLEATDG